MRVFGVPDDDGNGNNIDSTTQAAVQGVVLARVLWSRKYESNASADLRHEDDEKDEGVDGDWLIPVYWLKSESSWRCWDPIPLSLLFSLSYVETRVPVHSIIYIRNV